MSKLANRIESEMRRIAAHFNPETHIRPIEERCRKLFVAAGGKLRHKTRAGSFHLHWLPPSAKPKALAAKRVLQEITVLRLAEDADVKIVAALRIASLAWFDEIRLGTIQRRNVAALAANNTRVFGNAAAKKAQAIKLYAKLAPNWNGKAADLHNEIGKRVQPPCSGRTVRTYLKPA